MPALGLSESLRRGVLTTNQPNLSFERNQSEPYWLSRSRCPISSTSDSGSFKSIKSSTYLYPPSSILNGDKHSLICPSPPKSSRNNDIDTKAPQLLSRNKGGSDPHGLVLFRLKSHGNKASWVIDVNGTVFSLPNLPKPSSSSRSSKSSSHSFKSASDKMKCSANLRRSNTGLSESPPSPTSSEGFFVLASDKSLLVPQPHSPSLDGCVGSYFHQNLTTSPVSASPQKPRLSSYVPMNATSTQRPSGTIRRKNLILQRPSPSLALSVSGAESFETALTSPESISGSFETAPTSAGKLSSGSFTLTVESSKNMPEPRATLNDNVDAHRSATRSLNSTPENNIPLSLPQPQLSSNDEMHSSNSQSPHRSNSLFSPLFGREKLSAPKGPVHDGSLLTPAIHIAVNEAAELYNSTRWDGLLSPSEVSIFSFTLSSFFTKH